MDETSNRCERLYSKEGGYILGIILFLLIIAFIFISISRSALVGSINDNNRFVKWLQNSRWYQNSYLAGIVLFIANAVLFLTTIGILYVLMLFFIPYVHFIVMIIAIIFSVGIWIIFNKAWNGSKKEQIIMASLGSSFYFALTVLFVYMYVRIEPYYPGEDTFMRALGLSLAGFVTAVACISCFVMTGFQTRGNLISNGKYNSSNEAKNSL